MKPNPKQTMNQNFKTFPHDHGYPVEQEYHEWKEDLERELRQLDDNPQELMDWIVEKTGVHDDGVLTEYANLLRLFIEQKLLGDAE